MADQSPIIPRSMRMVDENVTGGSWCETYLAILRLTMSGG